MSGAAPYNDSDGRHSIALLKKKKASSHGRHNEPILLTPNDTAPQKPSARNTPMLSFQPHHTEISTDRPSVSGRLLLHIPKIAGKRFHFVSLALHLRLKEAIAWTRQDLVSFEIEKQDWSQTVWDRKIMLHFQDRQVEEGKEEFVAVVKEPSKSGSYSGKNGRIEIAADEWRWEWLMPVTAHEVRPESFEGTMGNVWYELEAKCLFRWDEVDHEGNVIIGSTATQHPETEGPSVHRGAERSAEATSQGGGAGSLSKGKGRSLVQAFGKLRVGTKSKKIQSAGDFNVASRHDEYVENSLRMRNGNQEQGLGIRAEPSERSERSKPFTMSSGKSLSSPLLGHHAQASASSAAISEPLPFLVRKVLKLYFVKPPPVPSSSPAFFLPQPSMALPNLPETRRLKAIIPGARIQVQVQIPSQIVIRGYAQTSQLVPDPKKGGLVLSKHSQKPQERDRHQQLRHSLDHHHHHHHHHSSHEIDIDSQYMDKFQVALTVRKVTQQDINKNDLLKRRYQTNTGSSLASPLASNCGGTSHGVKSTSPMNPARIPTPRSRAESNASLVERGVESPIIEPKTGLSNGEGTFDGPQSFSTVGSEGVWRKEIRVRKVKCEFWQKETCRIPTSSTSTDPPSRSIKYTLSPTFTFSQKEQERERPSLHLQSPPQQSASPPWASPEASEAMTPVGQNAEAGLPLSSVVSQGNGSCQKFQSEPEPLSPLLPPTFPPNSSRKGSIASNTSASPSRWKPFMLLIPVPIDSAKLRQTFAWPSTETSLPVFGDELVPPLLQSSRTQWSVDGATILENPTAQPLYGMATRGVESESAPSFATASGARLSNTSEFQGASQAGTVVGDDPDTMDMRADRPHPPHHALRDRYGLHSNASLARPRIELKHYLTFRLSIDMLEFEGELEDDDDMDVEAVEELQLQQAKKRQHLSGPHPSHASASIAASTNGHIAAKRPAPVAVVETGNGIRSLTNSGLSTLSTASHASSSSVATASTGNSTPTADSSALQSPSAFEGSTAGLLDGGRVSEDEEGGGDEATYAVEASLAVNGEAAALRSGAGVTEAGPKGMVGGAIGALRKTASSVGLNAMMHVVTGRHTSSTSNLRQHQGTPDEVCPSSVTNGQQQSPDQQHLQDHSDCRHRQRSPNVTIKVQKLKDFVIRVPINVVMQIDSSRIGVAGNVAGTDSATNTNTERTETADSSLGSEYDGGQQHVHDVDREVHADKADDADYLEGVFVAEDARSL
ncbi:hypothetical protein BGZ72_007698 [Mortierella alpina]|nr:hypothetical protein BGZ72_007698 [Mortierella alpina]